MVKSSTVISFILSAQIQFHYFCLSGFKPDSEQVCDELQTSWWQQVSDFCWRPGHSPGLQWDISNGIWALSEI